jgi:anti-sigma factor RsiW
MAKLPSLSAKEREDLVAYLDGELDAQAAGDLEVKLNLDAEARAEAEALRRTWEMLDYLPRPEPAPTFASRTLERVSSLGLPVQPAEASEIGKRWRPWLLGGGWAAAVLLAGTLGYAGVSWLSPSNPATTHTNKPVDVDALLVKDLRLIENKRLYDLVDDVGFLRELDAPDLFGDDG